MTNPTLNSSVDAAWLVKPQFLEFRLGPLKLGKISVNASVLTTQFIELPRDVSQTAVGPTELQGCTAAVIPGHPDLGTASTVATQNGLIRYVSFREVRFLVELRGTFTDYLAKFSAKRRGNLIRTVKKFIEFSGGKLDCREFHTGPEMLDFQRIAVEVSGKTYKQKIGWTFQSSREFGEELIEASKTGAVRGYVLYHKGLPAAYAFCRVQKDVVYYTHISYDPQFSEYSPGTVLLYVLIERLYAEGRFTHLDFLGGAYWQYKQVFSTVQIPSATLFYFRPTLRNWFLLVSHLSIRVLESMGVTMKRLLRRGSKKGDS